MVIGVRLGRKTLTAIKPTTIKTTIAVIFSQNAFIIFQPFINIIIISKFSIENIIATTIVMTLPFTLIYLRFSPMTQALRTIVLVKVASNLPGQDFVILCHVVFLTKLIMDTKKVNKQYDKRDKYKP